MLSTLVVVFMFALAGFAQPAIVGGYKTIAVKDKEAIAAADFALDNQSQNSGAQFQLKKLVKAEVQIVQGKNFRLCMKATIDQEQKTSVQAVVYRDLKGNFKLTNFEDSNCDGSGPAPKAADGYKSIKKTHAGADLAAQFAVNEKSKTMKPGYVLDEVVKAEIKEGTITKIGSANFRDCLKVTLNGDQSFVQAVVSMDQYSNFKLISWEDSKCGRTADGFEEVEKTHAGIGLAADFAVKKHSEDTKINHTLVGILKGETKGLFDMTYRVCMKVAEDGKTQVIRTVVTMDQYSNMKLISWQHSTCGN